MYGKGTRPHRRHQPHSYRHYGHYGPSYCNRRKEVALKTPTLNSLGKGKWKPTTTGTWGTSKRTNMTNCSGSTWGKSALAQKPAHSSDSTWGKSTWAQKPAHSSDSTWGKSTWAQKTSRDSNSTWAPKPTPKSEHSDFGKPLPLDLLEVRKKKLVTEEKSQSVTEEENQSHYIDSKEKIQSKRCLEILNRKLPEKFEYFYIYHTKKIEGYSFSHSIKDIEQADLTGLDKIHEDLVKEYNRFNDELEELRKTNYAHTLLLKVEDGLNQEQIDKITKISFELNWNRVKIGGDLSSQFWSCMRKIKQRRKE